MTKDSVSLREAVQLLLRVVHKAASQGNMAAEDAIMYLYDNGFPVNRLLELGASDPLDLGFFFWDETWSEASEPYAYFEAFEAALKEYADEL